ncbi:MAG: ABC transporter ATP-binding protein [Candidatus Omnitrophota bacterium]
MIEIKNLKKNFGDLTVLGGVNLKIAKGETLVIIGRSGCGKSVLLKHIIGLMKADEGQVLIEGKDITNLKEEELNEVRMEMGMLFQGAALFDSMSVGENVGFVLTEHTKLSEGEIARKVKTSLELVGLKGIENLKPSEISGGMQKRVGLARAICALDLKIVLYDEPTTGVDPIMGDAINDLIINLHDKLRITSVAVTHDMVSAYKIADRIAMLYKGKIIEIGTPDEIKNSSNKIVQQFIHGEAVGPITEGEEIKRFELEQ